MQSERGSVTVWMVLMVVALTLIVGIAVDLTGQLAAKRVAGDVAAEAARAAGEQVDQSAYLGGGSVEVKAAAAKQAALAYVKAAGLQGTVQIEGGSVLVVDTTAQYKPVFLSALGVGTLQVTGSARTRVVRVQEGSER
jgi:Flp pilus assembly protein TadG